ncbi:hypothetical protein ACN20G_26345 [Streptomyces sp. BI20]|uniref:hypothetical protein n=1 Tax=Streptomyces sp. BI20 TaxID=3403460 RepID=UPI003C75F040
MFSTIEFRVAQGQVYTFINGVDLVDKYVGRHGRGGDPEVLFPTTGTGPLTATRAGTTVHLAEPDCNGGCCGYLQADVHLQDIRVQWSNWYVPSHHPDIPDTLWFDVDQYARAIAAITPGPPAPPTRPAPRPRAWPTTSGRGARKKDRRT